MSEPISEREFLLAMLAELEKRSDIRFFERDIRYEQRFAAQERAVEKSETAQRDYNAKSNEFRAALDDSNKDKIGRQEFDARLNAVNEKIDGLTESRSKSEGRSGGSAATIALIFSSLSALATIVGLFVIFSK
jgi:hypothetical protein